MRAASLEILQRRGINLSPCVWYTASLSSPGWQLQSNKWAVTGRQETELEKSALCSCSFRDAFTSPTPSFLCYFHQLHTTGRELRSLHSHQGVFQQLIFYPRTAIAKLRLKTHKNQNKTENAVVRGWLRRPGWPSPSERLSVRNPAGLWYAGLGAADVTDGLILYQKKIPLV